MLITIDEYGGGYQVSLDSVARNIGEVYFCQNDTMLCELLGEYL